MRQRSAVFARVAAGFVSAQRQELLVALAIGLLTYGLWPVIGRPALIVPGLVILWVALPTRRRFVEPMPAPPPARRAS